MATGIFYIYKINNIFSFTSGSSWSTFVSDDSHYYHYSDFTINNNYVYYKGKKVLHSYSAVSSSETIVNGETYYLEEEITDLTDTIWLLNDTVDDEFTETTWNLNYSTNNNNYTKLSIGISYYDSDIMPIIEGIRNGGVDTFYSTSSWHIQNARYIKITGGYAATSPVLITWFINNGKQLPTNLTDTKWYFNDYPNVDVSTNFDYSINFINANNNDYIRLVCTSAEDFDRCLIYDYEGSGADTVYSTGYAEWEHEYDRTIEIKDGIDIANDNLIFWLGLNATQVFPKLSSFNNLSLNNNILNINGTSYTLSSTFYSGNSQTEKSFRNIDIVDNNNGTYTLTVDGNITIVNEYVPSYAVTIHLNEATWGTDKTYVKLYDGQDISTGTLLFEDISHDAYTDPINVVCHTGYISVDYDGHNPVITDVTINSGNITFDWNNYYLIVGSDGECTITILYDND